MKKDFHTAIVETAKNHIELAREELNECSVTVSNHLVEIKEKVDDKELHQKILDALTSLQLVDIITQRLDKIENFLNKLNSDTIITEQELEEFAWKNELEQSDIDNFFNNKG